MTDRAHRGDRDARTTSLRRIVATNVRALAHQRGWSIAQLVDFAQVTRSALFKALAGDAAMTLDTLEKLALALDVDAALLLRDDGPARAPGCSPGATSDGRSAVRR